MHINTYVLSTAALDKYSRSHDHTRRVKVRNLPQGLDSSFLDGWPKGWNPHAVPIPAAEQIFTLLDFQPDSILLVVTILCGIWL